MTQRVALVSALLVAGLLVAVIGATAALHLIASGPFGPGGQPLSEADVRRSFAHAPAVAAGHSPAPVPHTSQSSGTPPLRVSGSYPSSGGTVIASCAAGQVTLTNWIPNSGYGTDGSNPGPAASAWVKFKSGGTEVTVTVSCVNGKPSFVTGADNRGGGRGGDGGSGH